MLRALGPRYECDGGVRPRAVGNPAVGLDFDDHGGDARGR